MRAIVFVLGLVACGGGAPSPGADVAVTPAAATVAPTAPAVAAEVGPDGPADITAPVFTVGTGPEAVAKGKATFDAKGCGACHAFGSILVGPDLNGVGERRTDLWIAKMITHADEMTKKDPNAKALFAKHMLQMPNQGVADAELGDLIAFLKSAH